MGRYSEFELVIGHVTNRPFDYKKLSAGEDFLTDGSIDTEDDAYRGGKLSPCNLCYALGWFVWVLVMQFYYISTR